VRDALPVRPTAATIRAAEIEAAEAQHELTMAGEDSPRVDLLRRRAADTACRARRLRSGAIA
jgi:hypothetical protein